MDVARTPHAIGFAVGAVDAQVHFILAPFFGRQQVPSDEHVVGIALGEREAERGGGDPTGVRRSRGGALSKGGSCQGRNCGEADDVSISVHSISMSRCFVW